MKRKTRAREHLEAVTKAYLARPKNGGTMKHPNSLANLKRGGPGNPDLPKTRRRCNATRSDGQPCKGPAVRGSERCKAHGGMRDAPAARGNITRLLDGRLAMWADAADAGADNREASPEIAAHVRSLAAPSPCPATAHPSALNIREGIRAYTAARRGEATRWQAWLAQQPQIAATFEAEAKRWKDNKWPDQNE